MTEVLSAGTSAVIVAYKRRRRQGRGIKASFEQACDDVSRRTLGVPLAQVTGYFKPQSTAPKRRRVYPPVTKPKRHPHPAPPTTTHTDEELQRVAQLKKILDQR